MRVATEAPNKKADLAGSDFGFRISNFGFNQPSTLK